MSRANCRSRGIFSYSFWPPAVTCSNGILAQPVPRLYSTRAYGECGLGFCSEMEKDRQRTRGPGGGGQRTVKEVRKGMEGEGWREKGAWMERRGLMAERLSSFSLFSSFSSISLARCILCFLHDVQYVMGQWANGTRISWKIYGAGEGTILRMRHERERENTLALRSFVPPGKASCTYTMDTPSKVETVHFYISNCFSVPCTRPL